MPSTKERSADFIFSSTAATYGTPDKVADDILKLREEVGEFGTMLYAGKDWKDRELGRKSMILLAEKSLPLINAGISKAEAAE